MGWVGAAAAVVGTLYSIGSSMSQTTPNMPVMNPPAQPNLASPSPTSPASPSSPSSQGTPQPSLVSPILQQPTNQPNIVNSPADAFSTGSPSPEEGLIKKSRTGGMKVGV